MEEEHIRLVEEGNTIYEIDLDCVKRKQQTGHRAGKERGDTKEGKESK